MLGDLEKSDKLYYLSCGPEHIVNSYSGCNVKGKKFLIKERDSRRSMENKI